MSTTAYRSRRQQILLFVAGGGAAAAAAILLCRGLWWNGSPNTSTTSTTTISGAAARRRLATQGGGVGGGVGASTSKNTATTSILTSPLHIDPAVNPILLLGLPKSGSEAIHHFLTCLRSGDDDGGGDDDNWTSQHYCCDGSNRTRFACREQQTCGRCVHRNMLQGRPALENCHGPDARPSHIYAQFDAEAVGEGDQSEWFLPQHFCLPLLHRDYPEAIWILNARDPQRWAANVRHWHSATVRLLNAFDLPYHGDPPSSATTPLDGGGDDGDGDEVGSVLEQPASEEQLYAELQVGLERARNATEHERRLHDLVSVYEQHAVKVRDFARNYHRGGTFLEVNVDGNNNAAGDGNGDGADPPYLTLARGLGLLGDGAAKGNDGGGDDKEAVARAKACWKYDADALDNDWKDFAIDV